MSDGLPSVADRTAARLGGVALILFGAPLGVVGWGHVLEQFAETVWTVQRKLEGTGVAFSSVIAAVLLLGFVQGVGIFLGVSWARKVEP